MQISQPPGSTDQTWHKPFDRLRANGVFSLPRHLQLTDHASTRMQQRGIPSWFLRLLIEHGKSTHDGHGALVKSVSKVTRRRLQAVLPHRLYVEAERHFDVYAVLGGDQAVITAAHRTHRRMH